MQQLIYKILRANELQEAEGTKAYAGSAADRNDGFIHFSARDQVETTAAKHFAGESDLTILAFETGPFGDALKWEPSRGGALFPHLYQPLDISLATGRWPNIESTRPSPDFSFLDKDEPA
jgi:uncharacterized protein (DUF952 family)